MHLQAMRMRRGADHPAADRSTRQKACLTPFTSPASRNLRKVFWNTEMTGCSEIALYDRSARFCVMQPSFADIALATYKGISEMFGCTGAASTAGLRDPRTYGAFNVRRISCTCMRMMTGSRRWMCPLKTRYRRASANPSDKLTSSEATVYCTKVALLFW